MGPHQQCHPPLRGIGHPTWFPFMFLPFLLLLLVLTPDVRSSSPNLPFDEEVIESGSSEQLDSLPSLPTPQPFSLLRGKREVEEDDAAEPTIPEVSSLPPADRILNIGAVLSQPVRADLLDQQLKDHQFYPRLGQSDFLVSNRIQLEAHSVPMNTNPIRTAQFVCDLISKQVYAVIVSKTKEEDPESASPSSVSFTCGFYNIPVIGISNRDSSLSNKNLHGSFMRTIAPYSHQADVWIQIINRLNYRSVIFIHSSDYDGQTTLTRFQNKADGSKIKVESVIEYEKGKGNFGHKLELLMRQVTCRVFILYANKEDSEDIFDVIEQQGLTKKGFVWIVSEQSLAAPNVPFGILSTKLKNGDNEQGHIKDSVRLILSALNKMLKKDYEEYRESLPAGSEPNMDAWTFPPPPSDCGKEGGKWGFGIKLLKYLKNESFTDGATGSVSFDPETGDRLNADYSIVNLLPDGNISTVGSFESILTDKSRMQIDLDEVNIIWPGGVTIKPKGFYVPSHLSIVTIQEEPFIMMSEAFEENGTYTCEIGSILCPKDGSMACCSGYCIDLLVSLSKRLNFTYDLYRVSDGQYGSYEFDHRGRKVWSGLVGDLLRKKADLSIAPLTINPERAKVIDFTKPFKYQGIGMIQKKKPRKAKLESFLQPFRDELWLLVFASVFVVAAVLYILDRFSPFGRDMMKDQRFTNEKSLNFSSAIWFSFGVLLNSGIGEKTPMSFSARVLGMVWAGFSMIVVASYTANLAAWLVLDNSETEISGLEDPRLRNPVEGFRYSTVRGSFADMYFSTQVELSNMYRLMEENNLDSVDQALEQIRSGSMNVFFWDSPRLEYEAAFDCNLIIAGETFARSGYGIGLQKASFWSERITLELLEMHESGFMEGLDNKWILKRGKDCQSRTDDFQTTLGLETMSGVFFLVAGGIVFGVLLIIIEVVYKRKKAKKYKQMVAAKKCAIKWMTKVQNNRILKGTEGRDDAFDKNAHRIDMSTIVSKTLKFNDSIDQSEGNSVNGGSGLDNFSSVHPSKGRDSQMIEAWVDPDKVSRISSKMSNCWIPEENRPTGPNNIIVATNDIQALESATGLKCTCYEDLCNSIAASRATSRARSTSRGREDGPSRGSGNSRQFAVASGSVPPVGILLTPSRRKQSNPEARASSSSSTRKGSSPNMSRERATSSERLIYSSTPILNPLNIPLPGGDLYSTPTPVALRNPTLRRTREPCPACGDSLDNGDDPDGCRCEECLRHQLASSPTRRGKLAPTSHYYSSPPPEGWIEGMDRPTHSSRQRTREGTMVTSVSSSAITAYVPPNYEPSTSTRPPIGFVVSGMMETSNLQRTFKTPPPPYIRSPPAHPPTFPSYQQSQGQQPSGSGATLNVPSPSDPIGHTLKVESPSPDDLTQDVDLRQFNVSIDLDADDIPPPPPPPSISPAVAEVMRAQLKQKVLMQEKKEKEKMLQQQAQQKEAKERDRARGFPNRNPKRNSPGNQMAAAASAAASASAGQGQGQAQGQLPTTTMNPRGPVPACCSPVGPDPWMGGSMGQPQPQSRHK